MEAQITQEKRLFIGIPLSDETLRVLQVFQEKQEGGKALRWTPVENLHLTVYFFGNVTVARLPNLLEMLRVALDNFTPFELVFDRYSLAPDKQTPRMIWARYNRSNTFRLLVQRIEGLYQQVEKRQEYRKSPIPHVTLARVKGAGAFESGTQLQVAPQAPNLFIDRLILWESILSQAGAEYRPLHEYVLR